jgi:hypothetical protein
MKEEGVFDVYFNQRKTFTKIVEIDRKNVTTWHKRYYKRTRHTTKLLASATTTRRAVCQSLQTIFREESNGRGHHIKPKEARLINVSTILEVNAMHIQFHIQRDRW